MCHEALNQPALVTHDKRAGFLNHLTNIVEKGRQLMPGETPRPGVTAPVRVYCRHIASKRTTAQDKRK